MPGLGGAIRLLEQRAQRRADGLGVYYFQGREFDEETGLYAFRNRMFDPRQGRFISRDMLRYVDGLGLHEFVRGNPENYGDPYGLDNQSEKEYVKWLEKEYTGKQINMFIVHDSQYWNPLSQI